MWVILVGLGFESGANALASRCILTPLDMFRVDLTDIHGVWIVSILLIEFVGLHVREPSWFSIGLHSSWSVSKGCTSDHTTCHTTFTTIGRTAKTMITHPWILHWIKNVWSFQLYFRSCFGIFTYEWIHFDIVNIMSLRALPHLPRLYRSQLFCLWRKSG